ncbi:MAG: HAMP domain-containing protein [Kiritimatiellae bacterium]|nr:HAMP domain-containing protein [Kiritimatiellia bacterium]
MATRLSISKKINGSLLLLVFLPVCAILILIFVQVKNETAEMTKQRLEAVVWATANNVHALLSSLGKHATTIADDPILRSDTSSIEEKLTRMKRAMEIHEIFEDVVLIDLEGQVQTSARYGYGGKSWHEKWFDWSQKPAFIAAKQGRAALCEVRAPQAHFWFALVAAAPVWGQDGAIKAVVGAKLNMRKVWDIVKGINAGKGGHVFITDGKGLIIAHTNDALLLSTLGPDSLREQVLKRYADTLEYTAVENVLQKICSYRRLPQVQTGEELGWVIGIEQDVRDSNILIDRLGGQVLAFSIGSFFFLFLLGGFLTRNIITPIKDLVKTTERITNGTLDARSEITNKDEIGDLAQSFNKMTQDLQQTIISRDLEIKARKEAQELLRTARFQNDFSGLLNIISISDVIQLINSSRKSGSLEIRAFPARVIARLDFVEGEIISAACDGLSGERAVYKTLGSKGEEFHFTQGTPARPAEPIKQKTMGLLMEGARLMDEGLGPGGTK